MSQYALPLSTNDLNWSAIIDLLFTSIAVAVWVFFPQSGPWPLLLVVIPWVLRFQQTGRLSLINPLALPLGLFMITAVTGLLAAYNTDAAWAKFWLLIASFFLFYTLSNQPAAHLWMIVQLLGLVSFFIGVCFLLTHDWQVDPTYIGILDRVAEGWMTVRPNFGATVFHSNQAAGLMAVFTPIGLAAIVYRWGEWSKMVRVIVVLASALLAFALLLTGSRGAWLALGAGLGLWMWSFISRWLAQWKNLNPRLLFWIGPGLAGIVGTVTILLNPENSIGLANMLPGAASADSRAAIYSNTIPLIGDFPFTGGGLDSFGGLYSQYILVVPQRIFTYAHNLYLDVALEQGIVGLTAVLAIFAGSFWLLGQRSQSQQVARQDLLKWAIAAGLMVLMIHGFLDDAFYGNRGTPLLLLLPGLAVALNRADNSGFKFSLRHLVVVGVILLAVAINFLRPQWQAAWMANVGAVEMARIQLADWPTNEWEDGRNLPALQPAREQFLQALEIDPANRTAHHRLGMIAMLEQDFETAVDHLETAYQIDASHNGIHKALAYAYVWNNQFNKAQPLLITIPEAQSELEVYSWWWATQNREDLAGQAIEMLAQLQN